MKQAVILAHPSRNSFNAAVADAYAKGLSAAGGAPLIRDLYALDFDPRLSARELPWAEDFAVGPDVLAERALLFEAQVFVLVYPLWFNAPPAILKGYVERVLGMGFGYGRTGAVSEPLLRGRGLLSFTTSGSPGGWAEESGALARLRAGFDDYLAQICGLSVIEHRHFGGIIPGLRPDAVRGMLDEVAASAMRLYGRSRTAPARGAS